MLGSGEMLRTLGVELCQKNKFNKPWVGVYDDQTYDSKLVYDSKLMFINFVQVSVSINF
jgi:hypothetical protein